MSIRVHKLAKELGVTSKDIMAEARKHGVEVKNHMGSLTEAQANLIRAFLYVPPPKEEPKPVEAEAPAVEEAPVVEESKVDAPPKVAPVEEEPAPKPKPKTKQILETVSPPGAPTPEEKPVAAEVADAPPKGPREVTVSGDIAARIVNRPEGEGDDGGSEPAPKTRETKVVSPTISPGAGITIEAKELGSLKDRETTKGLPERRGPTILGHKDIPQQTRSAPSWQKAPQMGNLDSGGMIQTSREGSKRTFVRAPQRGGGYRGPGGRRGGGQGNRMMPRRKKAKQPVERPTSCEIQLPITVKDLSAAMGLKAAVIIESLIRDHGMFPSINTTLDKDTVELIGLEFECEIQVKDAENLEKQFVEDELEVWDTQEEDLVPRAPVVTFLGHVDHGKTTLLDYIRKSRVAEREAGGITQHIGAWRVNTPHGDVVFLDTPGHKAFTEMRARGAQVTDLVVLVVAADEGVKPQTEEAVAHAQAAETPIVVALTKCDKHEANPMQVKQQLVGLGLQPEEWGGDTVCVEVSGITGKGVDDLLEYLGLVSEVLDLKADPKRPAIATVIEAYQRKGEGNVARLIVTDGTLHRGDTYLVGHLVGKIKAIRNQDGKMIKEAGPSMPVEVPSMPELPRAGDRFYIVRDVAKAKQLADERQVQARDDRLAQNQRASLDNLLKQAETGRVNIILKTDTQGSLEVLKKEILSFKHDEIEPRIIHGAVGGVTETDVTLADASDAVILGFNVTDNSAARKLSKQKRVEIRHYSVIYKLLDELKDALEGQLAPEELEKITGHVEVLKTFKVSKLGTIAGCLVQDGVVRASSRVRITRDGILIHEGKIASLRHVKDDVREVKEGSECGIRIDGFDDIKVGDILEPYDVEKVKRTLSD